MAINELRWNNIQANFGNSNQANAIGSQMLSNAGNIFSKVADYTQEETKRLNEERDKLFESAGRELSNIALQEGMEATVLPDGSIRHTFNADKYDETISRIATERGYDQLGEDARAKIWASLNTNTDYQLGLANNQANAQNAINRDRLALERKRLGQQDKIINKDLFNNVKQSFMNYVLSSTSSPEDKIRFIQSLQNSRSQLTDPTQIASIDTMLYLANNPEEVESYTKSLDSNNPINYQGTRNLLGRAGITEEDLANNTIYQNLYKNEMQIQNTKDFINSLNDGTFGINTVNDIKKENKITSLNNEAQEEALGQIMNIYALSLVDDGKSPEEAKNATKSLINNYLQTTKDEDGNIIGKININTQDILDDLVQNNYSSEVRSVIGQVSDEKFNKLSETAQKLTGISMNTNTKPVNKTVDKPKTTTKDIAIQSANSLSKKYNITLKNMNNVDESLYRNSKNKLNTMFNNLKNINSSNYKTSEITIPKKNNEIYKSINFINMPSKFSNFLQSEFNKGNTDINTAYALNILITDPSFSNYQTKLTKYIKSEFSDNNLKKEINTYQQEFIQSLEQLKNQIYEVQYNDFNKKTKQEYNRQQNEKEFRGY